MNELNKCFSYRYNCLHHPISDPKPIPNANKYNWTFLYSFAAVIVSQKLNCPMIKVSAFKNSGLKVNEVIQIGYNSGDANRFATMKNVANKYLYVWTRVIQ